MKQHEKKLREEHPPYVLVLSSGERVKVRSHDHIFFPPTVNEDGKRLTDAQRADVFQVWGNGESYRWVAFAQITSIEAKAPKNGE